MFTGFPTVVILLLFSYIAVRIGCWGGDPQGIGHDQSGRSYVQERLSNLRRQLSRFTLSRNAQCELHP